MNKFKKTGVLLSGVLAVLLFSSLGLSAQNTKSKQSISVDYSVKDSVEALEKIRVSIKEHEKTINLLESESQSQNLRLRDYNLRRDSIGILISVLSTLDSSSMDFKVLEAETTYLMLMLDSELLQFAEEKMVLNKKIVVANNRTMYLSGREKALVEHIDKFKKK
ncbi:MAG: hypothetical protein WC089_00775 [Candidatus Paceibacterota bacterium]